MTDAFDPGPGWREVPVGTGSPPRTGQMVMRIGNFPGVDRMFVHEEPVPPLPTEPHTVIRVTWKPSDSLSGEWPGELMRQGSDAWLLLSSPTHVTIVESVLVARITGFEVLAVPMDGEFVRGAAGVAQAHFDQSVQMHDLEERVRRETAKAVLDRLLELNDGDGVVLYTIVASEFGVGP